jgi:hypothetical protein
MTGYTVHTGSNDKFASGWDQIFSGAKPAKKGAGKKAESKKEVKAEAGKKAKSKKVKRGK